MNAVLLHFFYVISLSFCIFCACSIQVRRNTLQWTMIIRCMECIAWFQNSTLFQTWNTRTLCLTVLTSICISIWKWNFLPVWIFGMRVKCCHQIILGSHTSQTSLTSNESSSTDTTQTSQGSNPQYARLSHNQHESPDSARHSMISTNYDTQSTNSVGSNNSSSSTHSTPPHYRRHGPQTGQCIQLSGQLCIGHCGARMKRVFVNLLTGFKLHVVSVKQHDLGNIK